MNINDILPENFLSTKVLYGIEVSSFDQVWMDDD